MNRITTCFRGAVILLSLLIGMSAQMYGAESVVFSDDFEEITTGDRTNPSTAMKVTDSKVWTPTGKVYVAKGAVKFNTGSDHSGKLTLKTPLDLSANGGNFTIKIKAIRWTTDAVEITMAALDGSTSLSTKTVTPTKTGKAPYDDDTMEELVFEMTGGTASTVIVISGVKRFFITDFTVLQEQSTPTEPAIIAPATVDFGTVDVGATADQTITITGANLTASITATITDAVGDIFVIKQGGTLPAEGGDIVVSAVPTKKGVYTANLTLTSGSVTKVVALTVEVIDPSEFIVTTIAELKAKGVADKTSEFTLTGDVTFVFRSGRNIYVKDATGGLLLLDGYTPTVTTEYAEGDVITGGLKGTLTEYNGLFEMIPTANTAISTSNTGTVTPTVITLNDLTTKYAEYESQLVRVVGVTLSATSFPSSKNIDMTQGTDVAICRNSFNVTFSSPFPTEADVIGLVAKFNSDFQLFPRNATDITTSTVGLSTTESISTIYTSGGAIHLSATAGEMIEVYNQMGQRLYAGVAVDGINQLTLSARGVLVVKAGTKVARVVL